MRKRIISLFLTLLLVASVGALSGFSAAVNSDRSGSNGLAKIQSAIDPAPAGN